MAKRKTEKDYHDLAESCGFKWIGPFPKNVRTKTWWECKEGHTWEALCGDIRNRHGCPHCAGNAKKTEKNYHILAELRGFKWVGEELPKNVHTKTWWECEEKHKWEAEYNSIRFGSGCPVCSGLFKKTKKDYHKLAKVCGFKWAGCTLPYNVLTKTWWECEKEHKWKACYNSIQRGTGCSHCQDMINGAPVSKPQIKVNNLLYGILNYPESRYRIDVAIMRNSQKIAVEYDCCYWHEGNEKHDAKRDMFLISCGWKILHIKSKTDIPTRKQLKEAINQLLKNKNTVNLYLEDWF